MKIPQQGNIYVCTIPCIKIEDMVVVVVVGDLVCRNGNDTTLVDFLRCRSSLRPQRASVRVVHACRREDEALVIDTH